MSHKCNREEGCGKGKHVTTLPASEETIKFREPTMGEMKVFMGLTPILAASSTDDGGDRALPRPPDEVMDKDEWENWKKTLNMVCTLSVKPKYTDGEGEQGEGEEPLDNVTYRDVLHMIYEITDASGLRRAQKEADPT